MKLGRVCATAFGGIVFSLPAFADQVITLQPGSQISLVPAVQSTVACEGAKARCICVYKQVNGADWYQLGLYTIDPNNVTLLDWFRTRAECNEAGKNDISCG